MDKIDRMVKQIADEKGYSKSEGPEGMIGFGFKTEEGSFVGHDWGADELERAYKGMYELERFFANPGIRLSEEEYYMFWNPESSGEIICLLRQEVRN